MEMAQASGRLPAKLVRHVSIHVVLMFAYFLPGGLLWNRVDPEVLGLPFSVFVEAVLLPALIFLNAAAFVRSFWQEDKGVTEGVAAAARPDGVKAADRTRG
jgi:hypothetical protein